MGTYNTFSRVTGRDYPFTIDGDTPTQTEMARINSILRTLDMSFIKNIELDEIYVPNKAEHLSRWVDGYNDSEDNIKRYSDAFTADIDSETVKDIMSLSGIDDIWKILLLMGIGVFKEHNNVKYIEIMKKLADSQRLFMIVASSDYIYGTNYQFCHTYLGKDIANSTNQKLIQAIVF